MILEAKIAGVTLAGIALTGAFVGAANSLNLSFGEVIAFAGFLSGPSVTAIGITWAHLSKRMTDLESRLRDIEKNGARSASTD